jgi:hypothetical protein
VTGISSNGYVGYLTCPLTNKTTISYIDKVRILRFPETEGQKDSWIQEMLVNYEFNNKVQDNSQPHKRHRIGTKNSLGGFERVTDSLLLSETVPRSTQSEAEIDDAEPYVLLFD